MFSFVFFIVFFHLFYCSFLPFIASFCHFIFCRLTRFTISFTLEFDDQSMVHTNLAQETALAPVRRSVPIQERDIDWMTQVLVSTFSILCSPYVLYMFVHTVLLLYVRLFSSALLHLTVRLFLIRFFQVLNFNLYLFQSIEVSFKKF